MAQRRMLSRRISHSKKVNKLSLKAQLIYTWTIPFLDDYGCFTADPDDIKAEVFPKNNKVSAGDIRKAIIDLADSRLIYFYKAGDSYYQQYRKFEDFQTFKTDRLRISDYPPYKKGLEAKTFQEEGTGFQMEPTGTLSKVKLSKVKLSKEGTSKEVPTFFSSIREYFTSAYKKKFGELPAIDFGKDGRNVKSRENLFISKEEAYKLIDSFLSSKKAEECGYTLSVCFSSHTINLWRANKLSGKSEDELFDEHASSNK